MPRLLLILLILNLGLAHGGWTQPAGRVSRAAHERGGFNPALKPFYHGVASGDPTASSVVLWTRVTPESGEPSIEGAYFVALDTGFTQPVATGSFVAEAARDYTVKIDVGGLEAGATYYYYFTALNAASLIGRARTCPEQADRLKFAVVSCANYETGYFNAYRQIAARNDLDAVLHLGDYIYEYPAGASGFNLPGRVPEPAHELLTLADYRTRYSLYRLDEDLLRLHQQHTVISVWDDHESANDAYKDGAQNHQPDEGPWEVRKAISKQVYFEWMPVRDNPGPTLYRHIAYGNLCALFMLDTRLEGRVQPPPSFDTPDAPPRTMISPVQYAWLLDGLRQSAARWNVLGNQVLFSTFNVGFAAGAYDGLPDPTNLDSIRQAENMFIDNWESYPTQRNSLIDSLRLGGIDNVVILSGDSHCSWAFDVTAQAVRYPNTPLHLPQPNPYDPATGQGYDPATGAGSWAVEFATPSVSSPNFDERLPAALAGQFEDFLYHPIAPFGIEYNPHLKYADVDRHGYIVLDLTDSAAQADFFYVPTVQAQTPGESFGQAVRTLDAANHVQPAASPAPPKTQQEAPAPDMPPTLSATNGPVGPVAVFSCYPNPAAGQLYCQIGVGRPLRASLVLFNAAGQRVRELAPARSYEAGVYHMSLSVDGVPSGLYFVGFAGDAAVFARFPVVISKL